MDWKTASVTTTRRPGDKGTKKIKVEGLVAVRYYKDSKGGKTKTVEIDLGVNDVK